MDSRSSPAVHPPESNVGARRCRSDLVGCSPARWTGRMFPILSEGCLSQSSLLVFQLRNFGQSVTPRAAESRNEKCFIQFPCERMADHEFLILSLHSVPVYWPVSS